MQTSTVYGINLTFPRGNLKNQIKAKENLTLKSKIPRLFFLKKLLQYASLLIKAYKRNKCLEHNN